MKIQNKAALLTILGSAILGATKSKVGSNSLKTALKLIGFEDGIISVSVSIDYIPAISYEDGPSYGYCLYGNNYNPPGSLEEKTIYFDFGYWFKKVASESDLIDTVQVVSRELGELDYEGIQNEYLEAKLDQAYTVVNNAIENNQDIANALENGDFYASAYNLREIDHHNLNPNDDGDRDKINECIHDGVMFEIREEDIDCFINTLIINQDNLEIVISYNPKNPSITNLTLDGIELNVEEAVTQAMEQYNSDHRSEADDDDKDFQEGWVETIKVNLLRVKNNSELRKF